MKQVAVLLENFLNMIIHDDPWGTPFNYIHCILTLYHIPAFCSTSCRQDPPPPPEVPRMPKAVVSRSEWFPGSSCWEIPGVTSRGWVHPSYNSDNWVYHPLIEFKHQVGQGEKYLWNSENGRKWQKSGKHQENVGEMEFRTMNISEGNDW